MKEDYLHFLWRMRFLPSRNLLLTNGEILEIIEFGEYNKNESGPDFFHAKLLIDGTLWFGHVEFHLKASDWYKHQHQNDPAYDHVILHVVWENDQDVFGQDKKLPTLLLSDYVQKDFSIHQNPQHIKEQLLPCTFGLEDLDNMYIEKEKEKSLVHRLDRKTIHFQQNPADGFAQVLYELIATAFGAKINRDPFWQLTRELPITRLLKMAQNKRIPALLTTSGIFEESFTVSTSIVPRMEKWQWKKKGLHPKGYPEIRVQQFAQFIAHFNFDFGFLSLNARELLTYIRNSFQFSENESVKYAKSFQDLIIINSFVPFLWWLGENRGEVQWKNKAIELLELIPAEKNHLTKFLSQAGFSIQSAYDSQSLLELYSLRCSRKKCLTCTIGNKILKR